MKIPLYEGDPFDASLFKKCTRIIDFEFYRRLRIRMLSADHLDALDSTFQRRVLRMFDKKIEALHALSEEGVNVKQYQDQVVKLAHVYHVRLVMEEKGDVSIKRAEAYAPKLFTMESMFELADGMKQVAVTEFATTVYFDDIQHADMWEDNGVLFHPMVAMNTIFVFKQYMRKYHPKIPCGRLFQIESAVQFTGLMRFCSNVHAWKEENLFHLVSFALDNVFKIGRYMSATMNKGQDHAVIPVLAIDVIGVYCHIPFGVYTTPKKHKIVQGQKSPYMRIGVETKEDAIEFHEQERMNHQLHALREHQYNGNHLHWSDSDRSLSEYMGYDTKRHPLTTAEQWWFVQSDTIKHLHVERFHLCCWMVVCWMACDPKVCDEVDWCTHKRESLSHKERAREVQKRWGKWMEVDPVTDHLPRMFMHDRSVASVLETRYLLPKATRDVQTSLYVHSPTWLQELLVPFTKREEDEEAANSKRKSNEKLAHGLQD